jgi:hypothetical protein
MELSVGTLTFHDEYNFGAVLQAYALQRTIAGLGRDNAIIDYVRPVRGTARQLFHACPTRAAVIHNLLSLSTMRSQLVLRSRFAAFRKKNLRLTVQKYHFAEELNDRRLPFDVYLSGSDIVWRPTWLETAYGGVYYLEFVKLAARVAYAPSFGVDQLPTKYADRVARYIARFDRLSAREQSACRIIRELSGRGAAHVLDPTLLLTSADYDRVNVFPDARRPYLLLYPMQDSDELRHLARVSAKRLGLTIVAIVPIYRSPWKYRFADRVVYDAGPAEFLGWIKHAAMVCTNSFHGIAFSIVYRKQFVAVSSHSMDTRADSLLGCVGLGRRQRNGVPSSADLAALLEPIDYGPVELRLRQLTEWSLDYLGAALN